MAVAAVALQTGCYSYLPLQETTPVAGTRVAVVLNDRGRVELGEQLGAALDRVMGDVVQADAGGVTLTVYGTQDLRGGRSTWTGERVTIPRTSVLGFQERELNRRRTALLAVAIVGGLVASILAIDLAVSGDGRDDPGGGNGNESRRR